MPSHESEFRRLLLMLSRPESAAEALLVRILALGGKLEVPSADFGAWRGEHFSSTDDEQPIATAFASANSTLVTMSNGLYELVQLPSEPPALEIRARPPGAVRASTDEHSRNKARLQAGLNHFAETILREIDALKSIVDEA